MLLKTVVETWADLGTLILPRDYVRPSATPFLDDKRKMAADVAKVDKALALSARKQAKIWHQNNQQASK